MTCEWVQIGADRDPTPNDILQVFTKICAEFLARSNFGAVHIPMASSTVRADIWPALVAATNRPAASRPAGAMFGCGLPGPT